MNKRTTWNFILLFVLCGLLLTGCNQQHQPASTITSTKSKDVPLRDNVPKVLTPEASGTLVLSSDIVSMDYSHAEEGYIMVKYSGTVSKVKLQLTTPDGTVYTYLLIGQGTYETFPLSGGSGLYQLSVLENVSADSYAIAFTQSFDATIINEFRPFLYPNQYVTYTADSNTVQKAKKLSENCYSDLDVVSNIYHYIIKTISYDEKKAQQVSAGYLPNNEQTLKTGTGICFDYASLMTAMLRSQGIPTKLEVGYAGEAYHSWISTYIKDVGWIDNIIEFDGSSWELMDPTLAANNTSASVGKYIGDGSSYVIKYTY